MHLPVLDAAVSAASAPAIVLSRRTTCAQSCTLVKVRTDDSCKTALSRTIVEVLDDESDRVVLRKPCVLCMGSGSVSCFDCNGKGNLMMNVKGKKEVFECGVCNSSRFVPCPCCLRALYKEVRGDASVSMPAVVAKREAESANKLGYKVLKDKNSRQLSIHVPTWLDS